MSLKFTTGDLFISRSSKREKYRRRKSEDKTSVHWGQRKLLLSEIEFLTLYWNANTTPNPLLVYVGAAPGSHIPFLSTMFPEFEFHLYDPARFSIKSSEKISIFNEYFTQETSRKYENRTDVFFVSDLRTADYVLHQKESLARRGITMFDSNNDPIGPQDLIKQALEESALRTEDQVWGDQLLQQKIVQTMNPLHALLKFRLPYDLDGKDRVVPYLMGTVYWQSWSPQSSSETRLHPTRDSSGKYSLSKWSCKEYEEWNFYHNSIEREQLQYVNIFTGNYEPIDGDELLNDYDSMAEAQILKMYVEKTGLGDRSRDVYQSVVDISRMITSCLNALCKSGGISMNLAERRSGPVKSSNKNAWDAFKVKQKGVTPVTRSFKHTNIDVNVTWRCDELQGSVDDNAVVKEKGNNDNRDRLEDNSLENIVLHQRKNIPERIQPKISEISNEKTTKKITAVKRSAIPVRPVEPSSGVTQPSLEARVEIQKKPYTIPKINRNRVMATESMNEMSKMDPSMIPVPNEQVERQPRDDAVVRPKTPRKVVIRLPTPKRVNTTVNDASEMPTETYPKTPPKITVRIAAPRATDAVSPRATPARMISTTNKIPKLRALGDN